MFSSGGQLAASSSSRIRSKQARPSFPSDSGSITRNSSALARQTRSLARVNSLRVAATFDSTASPTARPWWAFTLRNPSTSTTASASFRRWRLDRFSSPSRCRSKATKFGRSVSASRRRPVSIDRSSSEMRLRAVASSSSSCAMRFLLESTTSSVSCARGKNWSQRAELWTKKQLAGVAALERRTEDVVPERGAYAKAARVVLEVMAHVQLVKQVAKTGPRLLVVHVVVRHVVGQIPREEAGSEEVSVRHPDREHEEPVEDGGQRHADRGWHYQPHRVIGMVVVHAVDDPVKPGAQSALGLEVENQAVHPALGERPQHITAQDPCGDLQRGRARLSQPEEQRDDRGEDDRRHDRVHTRETIETVGLEHPRRSSEDIATARTRHSA